MVEVYYVDADGPDEAKAKVNTLLEEGTPEPHSSEYAETEVGMNREAKPCLFPCASDDVPHRSR
jgi:hypothetical protein